MSNFSTNPLPLPSLHVPGTALGEKGNDIPTLFCPITIRGLCLQHRFVVSPMGMFSCQDGHLTDFHLVHLGSLAIRGAGLIMVEATAVTPNGRVTPRESGLWQDSQVGPLKRVVDFIHSQGQKAAIQLFHSGRKASVKVPWETDGVFEMATSNEGGWPDDVWAPSPISAKKHAIPKPLEQKDINQVIQSFAEAAKRAVEAGVDLIEIHGAHGYLVHQFLSPLTNQRTDHYGGSFENRCRFLFELLQALRAVLPDTMPLSLRLSATDWMEWTGRDSWTVEETLRLAKLLPSFGVDIVDVSSGGNHDEQKIQIHPYYQVDFAAKIRQGLREDGIPLLVAAVGLIDNPEMASSIVQGAHLDKDSHTEPQADLVFVGRQFLRDPQFVLNAAKSLGVKVQWPLQYSKAQK